MSRNFEIDGPASLIALAACKLNENENDENVSFAFGALARTVPFELPRSPRRPQIPGANLHVSVQRIFSGPETHRYHCTIHPEANGMTIIQ